MQLQVTTFNTFQTRLPETEAESREKNQNKTGSGQAMCKQNIKAWVKPKITFLTFWSGSKTREQGNKQKAW